MRNDGRDNLLGALLIAGQFVIPEVTQLRRHIDRDYSMVFSFFPPFRYACIFTTNSTEAIV